MAEEEEVLYIEYEEEDEESSSSVEIEFDTNTTPSFHRVLTDSDITRMAMNDIKKKYNGSSNSSVDERIVRDFYTISKRHPKELGFTVLPYNNDIHVWEVRLWSFDKDTPIYKDMQIFEAKTGRNYIELRVSFPPNYPIHPPFIRVVYPRCTGERVLNGGAFCISALTLTKEDGWSPIYDFEDLLSSILVEMRSQTVSDPLRINFENDTPYSVQEAISTYRRLAGIHGWTAVIKGYTPQ